MSGRQVPSPISFLRVSDPPRVVTMQASPSACILDLSRTALVIVDMQNDFLHPDGWFAKSGIDPAPVLHIVPVIADLAARARTAGLPVIWLNWGVRPDVANIPDAILQKASLGGLRPAYGDPSPSGRGRILVQGDWGAQTIEALTPDARDLVVHKHRLTGFHDNDFDSILRRRGVETLLFAGINTDRCVFATLTDAATRGFGCVLVEDACATSSPAAVSDAIVGLVRLLHGVSTTSADVASALATPPVSTRSP